MKFEQPIQLRRSFPCGIHSFVCLLTDDLFCLDVLKQVDELGFLSRWWGQQESA